jgi:hypothetical protein
MRTHYLEVPYKNSEVEVEFDYYKGWAGSREEPPEPEDIEITKVIYRGTDVTDIVDYEALHEELTDLIHKMQREMYDED